VEDHKDLRDFFISYTGVDREWAEWIASVLEEAGYSTVLQAWDFDIGAHFVNEMHNAMQLTDRTIGVLSRAYVESEFGQAEWQEAWRIDPAGTRRKLLMFRIEDCPRPGLLGQLVSEDLFGVSEEKARARLLAAVRRGRRKPEIPPGFPGRDAPVNVAPFPGRLVQGTIDEALRAGGPVTPDNPWAVAFAFWSFALADNYGELGSVITPESEGQWDLADIRRRTENSGITTAVIKPCYDVAYVRVISEVQDQEHVTTVAGGLMPAEARIITLVLRPECGGWRVHNFGYPQDPARLPRTWRMNSPDAT
jgi:TIR domain